MNINLAADLISLCAEVNDDVGISLRVDNVACRVLLPDSVEMPAGVPEGAALVVFAGSNDWKDWLKNAQIMKKRVPWGTKARVHGGFLDCFLKIEKALDIVLQGCREIVFAGHSQGGALAVLAASCFWQKGHAILGVYTFGSPRPASEEFREAYRASGLWAVTYRIVVGWDGVVRCPDSFDDYHIGKGYFWDARGRVCKEQRNPGWRLWCWLWDAVDDHIAADEYSRVLRRVAG